jgi:hypothetical protein
MTRSFIVCFIICFVFIITPVNECLVLFYLPAFLHPNRDFPRIRGDIHDDLVGGRRPNHNGPVTAQKLHDGEHALEPVMVPPTFTEVFPSRYQRPAFERDAFVIREAKADTHEKRKATGRKGLR